MVNNDIFIEEIKLLLHMSSIFEALVSFKNNLCATKETCEFPSTVQFLSVV